jgi:uncharacterized protein YbaR (Trm112 family)
MHGRITSNFVNEFNIFGAIKSDSIGSVSGGGPRADEFEVLSGEGSVAQHRGRPRVGLRRIDSCPSARICSKYSSVLAKLNGEIAEERLRNRGGERVTSPIAEGLVREDGRILYPIDDGIPVMLIEESIELG